MGFIILILFLGLPAAEIWVLNKVGSILGFWDTFFLLIASAVFGVYLAKIQGKAVLLKVQQSMAEGRAPTTEMLDGLLVFLGGILFVIPGFITDGFGLILIFPPTRWVVRWLISKRVATGFMKGQAGGFSGGFQADPAAFGAPKRPVREVPRSRGQVEDAEILE